MANFNRQAEVIVGPPGGDGTKITGNRIIFNIRKSDKADANSMEVQVYNLAPGTRKEFEDLENVVMLNAGYPSTMRLVAMGDITRCETVYNLPDRITTATCGDGLRTMSETRVSLSYEGAVSARAIIDDIAGEMELELRETEADMSGRFRSGWAFVGPAREAMNLVTRRFGLEWSIQNGELQVTERRGENTLEAVVISPQTGLIGSPQNLDDNREDLPGDKENPGVQFRCLMNPLIEPNGIVILEAREFERAEYRVKVVEHRGDTRGDVWETMVEAVER